MILYFFSLVVADIKMLQDNSLHLAVDISPCNLGLSKVEHTSTMLMQVQVQVAV